jgi:hypothetical protein
VAPRAGLRRLVKGRGGLSTAAVPRLQIGEPVRLLGFHSLPSETASPCRRGRLASHVRTRVYRAGGPGLSWSLSRETCRRACGLSTTTTCAFSPSVSPLDTPSSFRIFLPARGLRSYVDPYVPAGKRSVPFLVCHSKALRSFAH